MKAFWDNYLYDLGEGNLSSDQFADRAGKEIGNDFYSVERAIKDYDLKKALQLIEDFKKDY